MSGLIKLYTRSFERSPYGTLLVANGILSSVGDIAAQTLMGSVGLGGFDVVRTARFFVFGASIGPLGGAWNKFLEVKFPLRAPPRAPSHPLEKEKFDNPIPGMPNIRGAKLERGAGAGAGSAAGAARAAFGPQAGASKGQPGTGEEGVSAVALAKRVAADQLIMAPTGLFLFLFSMGLLEGLDGDEIADKVKTLWIPILIANWQVWPILQLINFRYIPLRFRVPFASICGIFWTCFLSWRTSQHRPAHEV